MPYFVAEGQAIDFGQLRSTDSIGSVRTLNFTASGSYFFKVDAPIIGEQFGYLSDVSLIGSSSTGILQNVTQISTFTLHQLNFNNGKYGLFVNSSGGAQSDQVLGSRFPNLVNNSVFYTLNVEPGLASSGFTPEFYLEVGGSLDEIKSLEAALGISLPDVGRTLVVRGSVSGQRDAAWGNWLDISSGGSSDPQIPPTPETITGELLATKAMENKEALNNYFLQQEVKAKQKYILQQDALQDSINRLNALGDQQSAEATVAALKTLIYITDYAQFVYGKRVMTTLGKLSYETVDILKKGATVVKDQVNVLNDPSLSNLQKFDQSWTAFLVTGTKYKGALADAFKNVSFLKTTYDFVKYTNEYNDVTVPLTKNQINAEKARYEKIISDIELSRQNIDKIISENSQSTVNLKVTVDDGIIKHSYGSNSIDLGTGTGRSFSVQSATGGVTLFSMANDSQTVRPLAGDIVIDGQLVRKDTVVFEQSRASLSLAIANEDQIVISNGKVDAMLIDVDRIKFADGLLATDIAPGENTGQAYRLYQAAFARTPDVAGLKFWINSLDQGQSAKEIARGFLGAPEFLNKYGSNLSDEALIGRFYQNILGRTPEAAGFNFWVSELSSGRRDRADVLAQFAESPENVELTMPMLAFGVWLDGA